MEAWHESMTWRHTKRTWQIWLHSILSGSISCCTFHDLHEGQKWAAALNMRTQRHHDDLLELNQRKRSAGSSLSPNNLHGSHRSALLIPQLMCVILQLSGVSGIILVGSLLNNDPLPIYPTKQFNYLSRDACSLAIFTNWADKPSLSFVRLVQILFAQSC